MNDYTKLEKNVEQILKPTPFQETLCRLGQKYSNTLETKGPYICFFRENGFGSDELVEYDLKIPGLSIRYIRWTPTEIQDNYWPAKLNHIEKNTNKHPPSRALYQLSPDDISSLNTNELSDLLNSQELLDEDLSLGSATFGDAWFSLTNPNITIMDENSQDLEWSSFEGGTLHDTLEKTSAKYSGSNRAVSY